VQQYFRISPSPGADSRTARSIGPLIERKQTSGAASTPIQRVKITVSRTYSSGATGTSLGSPNGAPTAGAAAFGAAAGGAAATGGAVANGDDASVGAVADGVAAAAGAGVGGTAASAGGAGGAPGVPTFGRARGIGVRATDGWAAGSAPVASGAGVVAGAFAILAPGTLRGGTGGTPSSNPP
jgi:hypothetical protein